MINERVIWTVLPRGWDENRRLVLSLFVSPRLSADGEAIRKLEEFPAFANWPARLDDIRFEIDFDIGLPVKGRVASRLDAQLWERLFPPDTPVRPFHFQDNAHRYIHSYPVRNIHRYIQQIYRELGSCGEEVPSIDDPTGPLALFKPLEDITSFISDPKHPEYNPTFWDEIDRAYIRVEKEDAIREARRKGHPVETRPASGQLVVENTHGKGLLPSQKAVQRDFFEAYRFYSRPGSKRPDLPDYIEPPPRVPQFDFHEMIALLADHPELLRRLGLVIDLIVDVREPLADLPLQGTMRVVPQGELPEDPPLTPRTRYELDRDLWVAQPRHPHLLTRGLLHLRNDYYELFQVDVDGGMMQTIDFADSLRRMRKDRWRVGGVPSEATAPALRSAGLTLARNKRAHQLLQDLQDQRAMNNAIESGQDVTLYAEDLVRGYRVDIFDHNAQDRPRWFSLHQRVCSHTVEDESGQLPLLNSDGEQGIVDEGYVKGTAAASERSDHPVPPSDDLYFHEAMFGWQGWSLSAPFPGKRVVEPGEGEEGTIAAFDPRRENPYPLTTEIDVVPLTLPWLRIGHTYRMRVRTVDLAGNSRSFSREELDDPDLTSEAEKFLRFEPVPSPVILRRRIDTEGESLEHLVIRSNLGQSAGNYAESLKEWGAPDADAAGHEYHADSQRHLAAPKGSLQMAEQHGNLDDAFGGSDEQIDLALRKALREEGTFLDEFIVDLDSGEKSIEQTTIVIHPSDVKLPEQRGDGLDQGTYAYYDDDNVELPYLPDPLAPGFSLTLYDYGGNECGHDHADWPGPDIGNLAGDWPELKPIRLCLNGVDARISDEGVIRDEPAAKFSKEKLNETGVLNETWVLNVTLAQGDVVTARLSSTFTEDRLQDMAIWQWMSDSDKLGKKQDIITDGRHWMFTPFRLLTFTHAVQQPLLVPDMSKVTWQREEGSTFATALGAIINDAKSTGRLDVYAEWTEDIDLPSEERPFMRALDNAVEHTTYVFGFDIEPGENDAQVTIPGSQQRLSRHEFGDTKHRRILYHSVSTTRFREFMHPDIASDLSLLQREEAVRDGEDQEVAALVHHIPSTARPAAPQVKYVLPAFRWRKNDEGYVRRHVRHGKAVRVWIDRPWFSSGDDEQLAVILQPSITLPPGWEWFGDLPAVRASELAVHSPHLAAKAESAPIIAEAKKVHSPDDVERLLRPYVTNWGSDPVWASEVPAAQPTVAAFPRHTAYAAGLSLHELPPDINVVAAIHEVHFDEDRKLWYSDIEIDPGDTYYPFVRLALARYQPYSLNDVHLSRVTMTDFIQLVPDRTTELNWIDRGHVLLKVEGYSGHNIVTLTGGMLSDLLLDSDLEPNTEMRAVLQRHNPEIPGDLGWENSGDEITLRARTSGFNVTWTAKMAVSRSEIKTFNYRILVTEVEIYDRDPHPDLDPPYRISAHDYRRERIVFADIFELWPPESGPWSQTPL